MAGQEGVVDQGRFFFFLVFFFWNEIGGDERPFSVGVCVCGCVSV